MEDNGILGAIPGEYIAQASKSLPNAETASDERMSAVVEAVWHGSVRVHFRRHKVKHRKHVHWPWLACRAEKA